MALLETLTDNFDDNSLDTDLWYRTQLGGAKLYERNGQIEITMPASSTSSTDGDIVNENTNYDFRGSKVQIQINEIPSTSTNANAFLRVAIDANNYVTWIVEAGTLYAQYYNGGVKTTVYSATYSSTNHKYIRIIESSGTIVWQTSKDGFGITTRGTWVNTKNWSSVEVVVGAICYQNETNPGNFKFDNFNIYPPKVFLSYDSSGAYASGDIAVDSGSGTWTVLPGSDMYFVANSAAGNTTVSQLSQDPSDILRDILDSFNANGGLISYDGSSIDDTGTTVSYDFISMSVLDSIDKVLELCPVGWYWYVDPATNLLHLHQKNNIQDHSFTLGRDLIKMRAEKRIEDVVNTIYFRGGDTTGSGDYLYSKYQDSDSVGAFGTKALVYVDQRVTVQNTADTIATRILDAHKAAEIRLDAQISDSNLSGYGYDIESVNIGDVINILNIPGSSARSLWDIALWDSDRWDYNLTQIGSMYLQITRYEYSPDNLRIYCSTIPPDVAKRIEDINRNLEAAQTYNNPDAPS